MLIEALKIALRAIFGGGADISAANPLPVTTETSLDHGVATGGSNTTLEDTNKGWQVNIWEDALVEVTIGGINYVREVDSNTATVLTFAANPLLPGGVVVAPGDVYSITRVVSPLNPLARANIFNTAYLTPADILAAALAPVNSPCSFRVEAAFDAAGILSVTITQAGVPVVGQLNGGVALNINSLYRFSLMINAGDTINFRYSVDATILSLKVIEVIAATS